MTLWAWKVSNASCTTNCLAPLTKVVHEKFGIIEELQHPPPKKPPHKAPPPKAPKQPPKSPQKPKSTHKAQIAGAWKLKRPLSSSGLDDNGPRDDGNPAHRGWSFARWKGQGLENSAKTHYADCTFVHFDMEY